MPYTNEQILRDKNNNPIPQIWDSTINKFVPYEGKVGLLGPNGQPVSETNPLEVRVRGLETELQELRQLMQSGDAKMQLTGHTVEEYNGAQVVRTRQIGNAYDTFFFMNTGYVEMAAASSLNEPQQMIRSLNGYGRLSFLIRTQSGSARQFRLQSRWYSGTNSQPYLDGSAYETVFDTGESGMATAVGEATTKAPFVRFRFYNDSNTADSFHIGFMAR